MFYHGACLVALLTLLTTLTPLSAEAEVLMVADEFPAMQVVGRRLKAEEGKESRLIRPSELPATLAPFEAVVVYIHGELPEAVERACIAYATNGGRLVLLHHSISSGKRKNADWLPFLGVELPTGDADRGGYKWIEDVTVQWVNLAATHYIMTNRVNYPTSTAYAVAPRQEFALQPSITLTNTEVYLNHVLKGEHTVLMGLKFEDPLMHTTRMENTAGWYRKTGQGSVVYLMPGHTPHDFEDPAYGRIVLNAIIAPR